jgi:aspartyl-tRNA(Asn)/glutamyl-tRNA(Gln) amidotransferase subunit A
VAALASQSIATLATALATNRTSSVELTEHALERIADSAGEGARTFTKIYRKAAIAQAGARDELRRHGIVPSPLAGLPVSIKDLFDVAGEVTLAASRVLAGAAPAAVDAPIVRRLRGAGAIIVGKTNMTEFAYSGLGLNPHYGTPRNPYDRITGRIPGGSSSGAAISVCDGMSVVGIGTDTGGSVRIPAALCGLVGFKPTARRIPREGALPLSTTFDSVGPIAASVADCALVDAVLAGELPAVPLPLPITGTSLGVVRDYLVDGLDEVVGRGFERALSAFSAAGMRLRDVRLPILHDIARSSAQGSIAAAEAFHWHRELLERRAAEYDPRVATRLARGAAIRSVDYVALKQERVRIINACQEIFGPFDALIAPTVSVIAPPMAPLESDDDLYWRTNAAILRNPSVVNFLDGCALSVPCERMGDAPVGLMLIGLAGRDRRVLQAGLTVESVLAAIR